MFQLLLSAVMDVRGLLLTSVRICFVSTLILYVYELYSGAGVNNYLGKGRSSVCMLAIT